MSKDLAIAGVMVLSCLAVSAVAFVPPKDATPAKGLAKTGAATSAAPKPTSPQTPMTFAPPPSPTPVEPLAAAPNAFDPGRSAFDPKPLPPSTFAPTSATPTPPALPKTTMIDPVPVVKSDEPKTHVVASGEMLGDISLKYYGTSRKWRQIVEANPGLDPDRLLVGQKITIPALKDSPKPVDAAKPAGAAPADLASGERSYTVKEGDRYYTIAQRELGDASRYKELETLNQTPGEELKVGQVIKLPAKKDAVAAAPAVKPTTGGAEPADDGKKRHTVAEGEMLGEISTKYYGTSKRWRDIVAANPGVDPDKLIVGQKLIIPDVPADAKDATAAAKKPDAKPTATGDGAKPDKQDKPETGDTVEYVVKSGDGSLYAIAEHLYKRKASHADIERIQKANPGLDASSLRVGQKIKVPGVKSDATTAKPTDKPAAPVNPFAPTGNPFGTDAKPTATVPPTGQHPAPAPNPFAMPAATAPTGAHPAGGTSTVPSTTAIPPSAPAGQPFGARPSTPSPTPTSALPPAAKPFDTLGSPTSPSPAPAANPSNRPDPAKPADDPFKDFFAR